MPLWSVTSVIRRRSFSIPALKGPANVCLRGGFCISWNIIMKLVFLYTLHLLFPVNLIFIFKERISKFRQETSKTGFVKGSFLVTCSGSLQILACDLRLAWWDCAKSAHKSCLPACSSPSFTLFLSPQNLILDNAYVP